jgi:hypothetical protein
MNNFINYLMNFIKNITIENIKKLLSFFQLNKYGLCPLSFAYSMVKSLLSIEKSQLIIYFKINKIIKYYLCFSKKIYYYNYYHKNTNNIFYIFIFYNIKLFIYI